MAELLLKMLSHFYCQQWLPFRSHHVSAMSWLKTLFPVDLIWNENLVKEFYWLLHRYIMLKDKKPQLHVPVLGHKGAVKGKFETGLFWGLIVIFMSYSSCNEIVTFNILPIYCIYTHHKLRPIFCENRMIKSDNIKWHMINSHTGEIKLQIQTGETMFCMGQVITAGMPGKSFHEW